MYPSKSSRVFLNSLLIIFEKMDISNLKVKSIKLLVVLKSFMENYKSPRSCLKWVFFSGILQISFFAQSKTYFIKAKGNDALGGLSITSAWKSVSKVNASTFNAGDSVLFEAGSSFAGNIYISPSSFGTRSKPLVFGSFGIGKAIIEAGNSYGLLAYNNAGIVIKNLIFKGTGYSNNTSAGVYFYMDITGNKKLDFVVIDSVEAYGFKSAGIQLSAWPTDESRSGYTNITISNSHAHHNGLSGISVSGYYKLTDTLFSHQKLNVIRCKVSFNDGILGWNTHSGNGIIIGQVDSCIIEKCEAFENGKNNNNTKGGPAGIWAWDSKHVIIQYCYSHHNRTQTNDGDGFDLDGGVQNSIMQYNYSHDNDGPGFLVAQFAGARNMKNLTVRYNISERDGRGLGSLIWSGDPAGKITAERIDFYNNTIAVDSINNSYANAAFAVFANFGAMKDVRVCNNIFMTDNGINSVDIQRISNLKLCNNVYFDKKNNYRFKDNGTIYSKLFAWQSATGQEMLNGNYFGFMLNPNLINPWYGGSINNIDSLYYLSAYRLKMNSKIIGKGLFVDSLLNIKTIKTDFYGDTINFKRQYTPGAHEIQKPIANFSFTTKCLGLATNFKNLITQGQVLRWDFGDGSVSNLSNPDYVYKSTGSFLVTLFVVGKFGYLDSITKIVQVLLLPKADFSYNNPCAGDSVGFKNNSSNSNNFNWKFGQGDSSSFKEPLMVFKSSGRYLVQLISGWSSACFDTMTRFLDVYKLPVINFEIKNACVNEDPSLLNLSDTGLNYLWDFGDNGVFNAFQPKYHFSKAGDYTVKLRAISKKGCKNSQFKVVSIFPSSKAQFAARDVCEKHAVTVQNTSTNSVWYNWDFGDTYVTNDTNPVHIYSSSGQYNILLKTESKQGCRDSMQLNLDIFPLPDAMFTITQNLNTLFLQAKDTSLPTYSWDFGNGEMPGSGFKLTKTYFDNGEFKIKLKVSTQNGCESSSNQTVRIGLNTNSLSSKFEPRMFALHPNPTQNRIQLCFDVPINSLRILRILDNSGKEVKRIDLNVQDDGNKCIDFELKPSLSSGVYRVVLNVGEVIYSGKLVLL